jgi:RHS repeat-associated protein
MSKNRRVSYLLLTFLTLGLGVTTGSAFYNPQTGRWLSRDPLFDSGFEPAEDSYPSQDGVDMYAFVRNAPINLIDAHGLISLGDIIGFSINAPCGRVSITGTISLVNWHVTGIGFGNRIACNGIRAFLSGQINGALKLLPYSKIFACSKGSCFTFATVGPLSLTFDPKVPVTFDVDLTGDLAPPAKPKCKVDLELNGTVTASGTIGYCCGK